MKQKPGKQQEKAPVNPSSVPPSLEDLTQSKMEQLVEKSGLKMEQTSFSRGYQVFFLEGGAAYIASNNDGGNWIILEFEDFMIFCKKLAS